MFSLPSRARGKGFARGLAVGALAVFCALVSGAQAGPPAGAGDLKVVAVRFGGDAAQTRMVIETLQPLSMRGPKTPAVAGKIVLSMANVATATRATPGPLGGDGVGHVKTWRIRVDGSAGASLEVDVAPGDVITHRFPLAPAADAKSFRYVIDVGPAVDVEAPATTLSPASARGGVAAHDAAEAPRRLADSGRSPQTTPRPRRMTVRPKVIVVDAGHGGHDPGAQAADLNEKDITLATALALRKRLQRDGRYKVVMTRDSDEFIPLPTRVQIARKAGADLFISLHADSAGADPGTHGASIYTLSDHGEARVTEVLGQGEWFTRTGNHAGDPAVGRILLDLTQRSTLNRSAVFAGLLIDRVSDKIDLLPRTHRDAGYFVLLAPDVPAVLLEMGFISSPLDQARLTDPAQRVKLTDAIGAAIDRYFDSQTYTRPGPRKSPTIAQARTTKAAVQLPTTQPG